MKDVFSRFVESLTFLFIRINALEVIKPFRLSNFLEEANTLILLDKGHMSYGKSEQTLKEGELLYIPGHFKLQLNFGKNGELINTDRILNKRREYLISVSGEGEMINKNATRIYALTFDTRVFESYRFFRTLNISPFKITAAPFLGDIMKDIAAESKSDMLGQRRLLQCYLDELAISMLRHLLDQPFFKDKLLMNLGQFNDERIAKIYKYIEENLNGDLSNKELAHQANVSEDYFSAYFKQSTGISPQDYVEAQRMDRAAKVLRSTNKKVFEIASELGFKDVSYFVRRFKKVFGVTPHKLRKQDQPLVLD